MPRSAPAGIPPVDSGPAVPSPNPGSYDPGAPPRPRSEDISWRTRRYLINMSIRLACLGLMLVVPGGWKLVMLAGAVLIPLIAVLLANDPDLQGSRQRSFAGPHDELEAREVLTIQAEADRTIVVEPEDIHSEEPESP